MCVLNWNWFFMRIFVCVRVCDVRWKFLAGFRLRGSWRRFVRIRMFVMLSVELSHAWLGSRTSYIQTRFICLFKAYYFMTNVRVFPTSYTVRRITIECEFSIRVSNWHNFGVVSSVFTNILWGRRIMTLLWMAREIEFEINQMSLKYNCGA